MFDECCRISVEQRVKHRFHVAEKMRDGSNPPVPGRFRSATEQL
jgi:hypothetical protein